jgi:MarR family transcriptional regulator, lower aerobic nicotinate degradation pathway regulator
VTEEDSLARLPASAGFLLSRVGTAIQTGFKELLAGYRLRPLEFAIMTALAGGAPASQRQLCASLGVDSGNMVELVDTLEALGYASRARDPHDRRRYLLSMTGEGHRAFGVIGAAVGEYTARFLDPLSPAELAGLVSALTKLYAATEEGKRLPPPPARNENEVTR